LSHETCESVDELDFVGSLHDVASFDYTADTVRVHTDQQVAALEPDMLLPRLLPGRVLASSPGEKTC
jgi:hypothetical protein